MCVSAPSPSSSLPGIGLDVAPFFKPTSPKGIKRGVSGVIRGLKRAKGGLSPEDIGSPPSPTSLAAETAPTTGRNKELAIKTARAQQKKRLALRGRRKTVLTGGQGVLGFPDIYRKKLLGQ